jgi:hypothetical protein
MIQTICPSGKFKTMETVKRSMVAKAWGNGGMDEWRAETFREVNLHST